MLQKKAAKGFHQGLTWEGVSSQKEKCVTVKSSKAYTHQRHQLWAQPQKNPRHVKASEARQLLGPRKASRAQAGRPSPGKQDVFSFRLANYHTKLLHPGESGSALPERIIWNEEVKAAKRPPGGGWWKLTCSECLLLGAAPWEVL